MPARLPAVSLQPVGTAVICVLVSCALVSAARLASLNGHIEQPCVALVHFLLGAVACIGCAILSLRAAGWWGRVTMAAAGVLTILPGLAVVYFVRNHLVRGFALGRV